MSADVELRAPLFARRIPPAEVIVGRVYLIHARNGGVGVAVESNGRLGYRLHRVKFTRHYLFVEWDWDEGPPSGTAIPLRALDVVPPDDDGELLDWLAEREAEHQAEVLANWAEVIPLREAPR